MADVQTIQGTPIWPWMQEPFGNWLFGMFRDINGGDFQLRGLDQYPGQLNVDLGQTGLPNVWNAWQPNDAGMSFLSNYLQGNHTMHPQIQGAYQTAMNWGGPGGQGTNRMNTIADYGAVDAPWNGALQNLMLTGSPSAAGNNVLDMAKYGMSGEWGKQLQQRASGGPSGAQAALQPFLTMPTRAQTQVRMPTPYRRQS